MSSGVEFDNGRARLPTDQVGSVLIVRAGGLIAALPVGSVMETMRPLPVARLSGVPAFVAGSAVVRGEVAPVVDLAALLTGRPLSATSRWVCVVAANRRIAVGVDAVESVSRLPAETLEALPGLLEGAAAGAVERLAAHDTDLLVLLRLSKLIPPEVWGALGSSGEGAHEGPPPAAAPEAPEQ
ncbi:MAG: chemotaxis protein CheW [Candidatus Wallbacteria bacterium]|nr:chemotaxis protein CheW [Candidatus Wallbacteria bacterium]